MRAMLGILWLFIGLGALIFHYGPGLTYSKLDTSGQHAQLAYQAAEAGRWTEAVDQYAEALGSLPEGHEADALRLQLEKAKAQMMAAELPEARESLIGLLQEAIQNHADDRELVNETRSTLANAQYYSTWLMRLEGASKAEWEPEIEAARQHYKALTEEATSHGSSEEVKAAARDMEAAIRLARMDLKDLQALPLPSQ